METDIDNAFSVIYDYMTVDELSLCEEAIINYIKSGGHNIDFLEDLTFEMENETVYKLTCYAAALLDEYVEEQSLIDINNRKVVSESKQYSCEEILQAKLALLTVEVTWSYVFTAWIPGFDILSISLTTVYAMASTTAYKHEYDECVKKRNNSGKKP
ncbi:MAG: hypothetical protein K2K98_02455 [Muribaculaceae bacterium]|nr:hypothetical protein [Muribaculaceae bacterium]